MRPVATEHETANLLAEYDKGLDAVAKWLWLTLV
jgi:hypothetical protein